MKQYGLGNYILDKLTTTSTSSSSTTASSSSVHIFTRLRHCDFTSTHNKNSDFLPAMRTMFLL